MCYRITAGRGCRLLIARRRLVSVVRVGRGDGLPLGVERLPDGNTLISDGTGT